MGYLRRRAAARSSSTLVVDVCAGWVDCTGRVLLDDVPDEEGIDEADDDAGAGAGASVAADVVVERPDFLPVPV